MERFVESLPFFTPEQRTLFASVAGFAEREIETRAVEEEADIEKSFREYLGLLADSGLLGFAIAYPHRKLDVRSLCLVRECLSYSSSLADLAFVMQGLGTYAISQLAPDHLRDFWMARALKGKSIAAFALTEPEAGSDVSSLKSVARRDGDAYVIDGLKRHISNAGLADFYTLFARTGTRADGRPEISAFVIGAKMPGFVVRERTAMLAPHPIGEIELNGLRVPAEDMIGAEGDGFRLALGTLDVFRASVGAAACGMARRALDESISYARTRRQFGRPLSENQIIQAKLADMASQLDAARLMVYTAAWFKDNDDDASTREASEAKLFATEAAFHIVDEAVQIHGGTGLVRGTVVERLYRDVRALRIYEGTSEIQKLIIAGQLLKRV
jgi:acyl-CoA dehydrogenase